MQRSFTTSRPIYVEHVIVRCAKGGDFVVAHENRLDSVDFRASSPALHDAYFCFGQRNKPPPRRHRKHSIFGFHFKMSKERLGDGWISLSEFMPEPGNHLQQQVQAVMTTTNFQKLEQEALAARRRRESPLDSGVLCVIDTSRFTFGFNNVVLKVSFSDNVDWIVRIQHSVEMPSDTDSGTIDLLSEITTMETISSKTTIPVPKVFAYDVSSSNGIGYPYILMEHINGRTLDESIACEVPSKYILKVANQMARVFFELGSLTFGRPGRIWKGRDGKRPLEMVPSDACKTTPQEPDIYTSREWFYRHRQENNRQALDSHGHDPQWRTACWVLKEAVPHILIEDRVYGPFPLCHVDLHRGNILFDDEYSIKGIIDWSQAQAVPVERLVICPEFITFPAGAKERNEKILKFKHLVQKELVHLEDNDQSHGMWKNRTLSEIFGTKRAEITYRCTYSLPHRAIYDGRMVAGLIYGSDITWEQLVSEYGGTPISSLVNYNQPS